MPYINEDEFFYNHAGFSKSLGSLALLDMSQIRAIPYGKSQEAVDAAFSKVVVSAAEAANIVGCSQSTIHRNIHEMIFTTCEVNRFTSRKAKTWILRESAISYANQREEMKNANKH